VGKNRWTCKPEANCVI